MFLRIPLDVLKDSSGDCPYYDECFYEFPKILKIVSRNSRVCFRIFWRMSLMISEIFFWRFQIISSEISNIPENVSEEFSNLPQRFKKMLLGAPKLLLAIKKITSPNASGNIFGNSGKCFRKINGTSGEIPENCFREFIRIFRRIFLEIS